MLFAAVHWWCVYTINTTVYILFALPYLRASASKNASKDGGPCECEWSVPTSAAVINPLGLCPSRKAQQRVVVTYSTMKQLRMCSKTITYRITTIIVIFTHVQYLLYYTRYTVVVVPGSFLCWNMRRQYMLRDDNRTLQLFTMLPFYPTRVAPKIRLYQLQQQ